MGIFDRMFGGGAAKANELPNAEQLFDTLSQRYRPVLTEIEQQNVQLQNLHIEDNKLFVRGVAPNDAAKNAVWDQVKAVDPNVTDIIVDITVNQQQAQAASAGSSGRAAGQTYTVKSGDTLSKISRQFYGDVHDYMRVFYANRDQLNDPNRIQVGQQLVIPPADNR